MNTFEVTIQRKTEGGWPVVVEYYRSGNFLPFRDEGLLQLELELLSKQTTPVAYGTVLGKGLFREEVRDAFAGARAESEDYLRVLLFVEADDLKSLHWERLCAPLGRGWDFLTLDQRLPFSLYLPSLTDRRFPPIGRQDLRALVLVVNPDGQDEWGLESFDDREAVSMVRKVLADIPCDVLATVADAVGPPTLDELCVRITTESYTILHIVCHGRYKADVGETILYLANADNQVDAIAGTRLLDRLGRLQGARGLPHFIFLAACQSASAEAEDALGGLGQRLVRELGMPAVLAMTDTVSVHTVQALTTQFYSRLRQHGEVDRALTEACTGLADAYDITIPALYSRLGGRPLFSETLDRPLTLKEIDNGLNCLEELLKERAPILHQTCSEQAATLRAGLKTELAALSQDARHERENALAAINTLCNETLDLSFHALAQGQTPPDYDSRPPFRGLCHFGREDREFFFGRRPLVERLEQRLNDNRFLAVLGPSGSGKSSLVLAGLIPALTAKDPNLELIYFTPGSAPLNNLEKELLRIGNASAIVVVDQFEELFTLCADEGRRQDFLSRLLTLAKKISVVLTMRADFWGECAPYPEFKAMMQAHQELIAPMNAEELRRAMEMQAGMVGLRFEANLSQILLDDVLGEPGAMPLLQHALLELWHRRHGRWLRAKEYDAIGGVQRAIAHTTDDIYVQLSAQEREAVRNIFLRLTRLDEEALQGDERHDTRRRIGVEEVVPAGCEPAVVKNLLTRLADARLIVTSRNVATRQDEIEVAHEALIRYWPRLRDWLDEDRAGLRLHERIRQAALEWQTSAHEESLLVHRGSRLDDAQALLQHPGFPLNDLERLYVEACVDLRTKEQEKEEQQRQRELTLERRAKRRLQWLAAFLGTLVSIEHKRAC